MKKLLIFALTLVIIGCSSKNKEEKNSDVSKSENKIEKIYIGTQNDYPPFAFSNDKGELLGYDVEVIKEIDKFVPQYEFEFVTAPWDSIFLSLESDKTQVVADEIAKNPEREEKYLFSDEAYFKAETVIIVKDNVQNITKLEDLAGKTVGGTVGDSYTQLLEKYNKEHEKKIIIKYTDSSAAGGIFTDVESGRLDAYVNDPVMAKAVIKAQGLKLKIVETPLQFDNIHLTFKKDEKGNELKAAIDPIIKALKADGTLLQLSKKWTDGEFIPQ